MASVMIVSVGTLKEDYLKDAAKEYAKRLSQYARVEEINLKEAEIKNEGDEGQISRALDAEGERILAAIPKDYYKIAMCIEGVQYDSVELAKKIEAAKDSGGKIALIIGSSHGLSKSVKAAADLRLSVSKLTFPHQLMRVMLFEILYRSFTIIAGKKYHK